MQKHPDLIALVSTLDQSLRQLDTVMRECPSGDIRLILLRRRHAFTMLRALVAQGRSVVLGMTGPAAKAPLPTSLYALWHTEKRLLDLYDRALAATPVHAPLSRLLAVQRAEAAQACQGIVDAIRNWHFGPVPAPGPMHCSA